jgi:hypothetical protein
MHVFPSSRCHSIHDYKSINNVYPEEKTWLTIHEEISKFLNLLRIMKDVQKFYELWNRFYIRLTHLFIAS